MDSKVKELLNQQVTKELYSSYLYLAFANYYNDNNLDGYEHWFRIQAQEEVEHAFKFIKYLQDNGEKVTLGAIDAPVDSFTSFRDPLVAAFEHEKYVTSLIHDIYDAARKVEDFRCCQFLEWFIAEQCEEEKNAKELVDRYDLFADSRGLYLLNAELKARPHKPLDFAIL